MDFSLATSDLVWILSNFQKTTLSSLRHPRALAILAGFLPPDFAIKRTPQGKPFIHSSHKNIPYLSVAHSGELLVLALSQTNIGIDIEIIKRRKHMNAIAQRYFSQEIIYNTNDFYRSWTAREAYIKAQGHGLARLGLITLRSQEDLTYIGYNQEFDYRIDYKPWENSLIALCRPCTTNKPLCYVSERL